MELQEQCRIINNQLTACGYMDNPGSEVMDAELLQFSNIYDGRVLIIDSSLQIIKDTYLLEEGDSIYYDSIVPHHVHAYEGQAAKILAVVYTPI